MARGPQSAQSVPYAHGECQTEPAAPSWQKPLFAKLSSSPVGE